ncbi:hypothetical protein BJ085DRAFT_32854 [Dimargaris cristalligena]|uniref:Uncharacterized protein n=1 Tax=Dimargaris cristalligena TaxID=215637 RepID=A0A4Q0A0J0_9FUNG|nr:hypothetical protein BJ085DRAFT_32854 [Dimargaris cristalligena]|eukprot:RKP39504.1 hypothetical protein BJ085DRAFT_32854 [Dimargaris cristalligena]
MQSSGTVFPTTHTRSHTVAGKPGIRVIERLCYLWAPPTTGEGECAWSGKLPVTERPMPQPYPPTHLRDSVLLGARPPGIPLVYKLKGQFRRLKEIPNSIHGGIATEHSYHPFFTAAGGDLRTKFGAVRCDFNKLGLANGGHAVEKFEYNWCRSTFDDPTVLPLDNPLVAVVTGL